jgi:hypothetical protein
LHPFIELFKGRSLSGRQSSKSGYKSFSRESARQPAIELRGKFKKKVDDFGFTIEGKEETFENMVDLVEPFTTKPNDDQGSYYTVAGTTKTRAVEVTNDNGEGDPATATKR